MTKNTLVNRRRRPQPNRIRAGLLTGALLLTSVATAGDGHLALHKNRDGQFQITIGKSGVIENPRTVKRVSVGNGGVVDLLILPGKSGQGTQLYALGRGLGTTNVTLWDAKDNLVDNFDVEVTHNLEGLKQKIHYLLPGEEIQVQSMDKRILLSGQVSNVVRAQATIDLAASFCMPAQTSGSGFSAAEAAAFANPTNPGLGFEGQSNANQGGGTGGGTGGGMMGGMTGQRALEHSTQTDMSTQPQGCVVNLMQIGGAQQVMLEVKVAEIDRTLIRTLQSNVNILNLGPHVAGGVVNGGATITPGGTVSGVAGGALLHPVDVGGGLTSFATNLFTPSLGSLTGPGAIISAVSGKFQIQAPINASRESDLFKILAEPTLTTLSGQRAKFLSGGEFPIPVPQSGGGVGAITITFKEFGVGVDFLPIVLSAGRINLQLNIDVTELSTANAVAIGGTSGTFIVPALTKRLAQSTVELADGQTIGIAGLISDNTRHQVTKFPGLGDIPVLGALMRSQQYRSGQSELIIFVTPHLAKPIEHGRAKLPTDAYLPVDEMEFWVNGRMEKTLPPPPERPIAPALPPAVAPAAFTPALSPRPVVPTPPYRSPTQPQSRTESPSAAKATGSAASTTTPSAAPMPYTTKVTATDKIGAATPRGTSAASLFGPDL
jgi:pilus assembly protein CpaC